MSPSAVTTLCVLCLLATGRLTAAQEADPEPPPSEPESEILGAAAAFDLEDTRAETVWIPPGTLLFREPDLNSAQITLVDTLTESAVLERRGDWSRVLYAERLGWVDPDRGHADLRPPTPPLSPAAPPAGSSESELERRLSLAHAALGGAGPTGRLGPYALITDVSDPRLLARIEAIASSIDTSYAERYGLAATPTGSQTVALFAAESSYRTFEAQVTEGNDRGARGHAGGNLAAMFVAEQRLDDVTELLVHELTHLLNRRALGETIPSWLEEGLANDLSYSGIDRQGRIKPGTLSGRRSSLGTRASRTLVFEGPFASLNQMLRDRALRQSTPLERLVELDREDFLRPQDRERHYIESAFLVRYLLDGEKRRHAEGFRRYLGEVAAGKEPDSARLLELLGRNWRQLELGLGNYLRVQSAYLAP